MSGFGLVKGKRPLPTESHEVNFKRKKQKVIISYDYGAWKTDDILLQALARQQRTPPMTAKIGQGAAWPGKEKALALIRAHDANYAKAGEAAAQLALSGSSSPLVVGGASGGTVPILNSKEDANLIFQPIRNDRESDEESCCSGASHQRAQKDRVAVVRPKPEEATRSSTQQDVHNVDDEEDNETDSETDQDKQPTYSEFKSASGKVCRVTTRALQRHIQKYSWILVGTDGLKCKLCQWSKADQNFVGRGFVQMKKLKAALEEHASSSLHRNSVERAPSLILEHLNRGRHYDLRQLKKIVDSIFFELSHNRPLSHLRPSMIHYAHCLQDSEFTEWLKQDVTYLSAQALLQLLHCIGDVLKEDLRKELSDSAYWAVCADGSDDITREHKVAVTVRMVTEDGEVTERFWSMTNLYDRTGRGHADAVLKELEIDGANKDLRSSFVGCSLDGTSSMSSGNLGAQQRLRANINCASLFGWCCAHLLSLASADSTSSSPAMKQFFQVLRQLWVFFSASQRRLCEIDRAFEDLADRCEGPLRTLVEPSETRWLAFTACTDAVRIMYPAIVKALSVLASEQSTATFLYNHLKSVQFAASLCLASDVLSDLNALSLTFQTRDFNILDCVQAISLTISSIRSRSSLPHRSLHYSTFLRVYETATGDTNVAKATFDAFHEKVGKPYLEFVIAELERRFASRKFVNSFSIFDVRNHPVNEAQRRSYGDVDVCTLCDHYGGETSLSYGEKPVLQEKVVPRRKNHEHHSRYVEVVYDDAAVPTKVTKRNGPFLALSRDDVLREWTGLRQAAADEPKLRKEGDCRTLFSLVNNTTGKLRYPVLRKLMLISFCLPLVSVECERVFSRLKLLKTSLRNCLSDRSLCAILLISTCNQETLSTDQCTRVIRKFTEMATRRADFCDLQAFKDALEANG